jgi:hypothetical protein
LTIREFVAGYKEGRDHSAEEVQAAIQKQVGREGARGREGGREGGREVLQRRKEGGREERKG